MAIVVICASSTINHNPAKPRMEARSGEGMVIVGRPVAAKAGRCAGAFRVPAQAQSYALRRFFYRAGQCNAPSDCPGVPCDRRWEARLMDKPDVRSRRREARLPLSYDQ